MTIRTIAVEIDGQNYIGRYAAAGGLVSVEHGGSFLDGGSGSQNDQAVAERLLREIVSAKEAMEDAKA